MTDHPATASFADFARILGRSRSWVTQLRQAGRLVLTPNGRLVLVAESLALIDATRDPAKDGVAARHAAERAARAGQGGGQPPAAPSPPPSPAQAPVAPSPEDGEADETPDAPVSSKFQHWREREQRAKALAAERANEIADGKLLLAEDAKAANAQAFTVVRIEMEQLAETLAPQMIGLTDEARARGLMVEAVEHALAECARRLNELAREPAR
jgi:hypothetical protein